MKILDSIFRRRSEIPLVGLWRQIDAPDVEMQFFSDGRLEYRVSENDVLQIIKLTYRVEGDVIVSDQPSAPAEERTRYRFEKPGTLVLSYAGEDTRYERRA